MNEMNKERMLSKTQLMNLVLGNSYYKAKEITKTQPHINDLNLFVRCTDLLVENTKEFYNADLQGLMIHIAFNREWDSEFKSLEKQMNSLHERNMIEN